MAVESSALNFNQPTPPVVKPLSEIAGVSNLGAQLMGAPDGAQARALIGTDQPTDSRPPSTHDHDGRYYTEAEIDTLLAGKAAASHNHDTSYYTKAQVDTRLAGTSRRIAYLPTQVTSQLGFGVITNLDEIFTWGNSGNLVLGRSDASNGMPAVFLCDGTRTGKWVKLVLTHHNMFAVTDTGELWGAGDNTVGQLGQGNTTNTDTQRRYLTKITIPGKTVRDVKISHGDTTSVSVYAITTDNLLYAWGNNSHGQLGVNNTTNQSTPQFVVIPEAAAVSDISVGGSLATHLLVRTANNKLHACGWNGQGALGLGDTVDRLQLVTVPNKLVSSIKAWSGAYNAVPNYIQLSMILLTSGQVQCAGQQAIGDGSTTQRTSFTSSTINTSNVTAIMEQVSCAPSISGYIAGGIVYLTGDNGSGQLGDGSTTNKNTYVQPAGAFQGKAVSVHIVRTNGSAAYATTLVLDSDGAVWATGRNDQGLCADGTIIDRTTFRRVPMPEAISQLYVSGLGYSGANAYVWALGASGRLYAWGNNNVGQLGLGHEKSVVRVPCEVLIR